ncbi:hypothetical protein RFI_36803, partial [Reticulomyxa filosa]
QVQEIIYSEQKEEHNINQRVLETTLVNPIKELEDKICFGFQCKHRNWLKVKTVKSLQNIHTNANANTIIKNVPNDNDLTMNGGDKFFLLTEKGHCVYTTYIHKHKYIFVPKICCRSGLKAIEKREHVQFQRVFFLKKRRSFKLFSFKKFICLYLNGWIELLGGEYRLHNSGKKEMVWTLETLKTFENDVSGYAFEGSDTPFSTYSEYEDRAIGGKADSVNSNKPLIEELGSNVENQIPNVPNTTYHLTPETKKS